jgi:chromosome partitioning protein
VGEIISCANQKGGVGKTTTVLGLASFLALAGRRIAVIDLDPQGNATSGLAVGRDAGRPSVYDLVVGDGSLDDVLQPTSVEGLLLAPSGRDLAGAEVELVGIAARERRLQRALGGAAASFDYVFLDCPPSLGLLTVNALTAADSVLVPIQCEYYALEGLTQLMETIELVRHHLNPGLRVKGILLTMYDGRTSLSGDVSAEVRRHFADQVYEVVVPRSVRLAEAPSYGQPIALYSPSSRGGEAYRALSEEIMRRDGQAPRAGSVPHTWATSA